MSIESTVLHDLVDLIVAPSDLKAQAHDLAEGITSAETTVDHVWEKIEGFWAKVEKETSTLDTETAPAPTGGGQVPDAGTTT
jgi:hypothetical protein